MRYITTKEAAEKWGIKERQVRTLCQEGRIPNITRLGRSWLIPDTTPKPLKGKEKKFSKKKDPLDLFLNPTYCETHRYAQVSETEKMLVHASELYFQGKYEKSEAIISELLETCNDDSYLIIANATLIASYINSKENADTYNAIADQIMELLAKNPDLKYSRLFFQICQGISIDSNELLGIPPKYIPVFSYIQIYKMVLDALGERSGFDKIQVEMLCRLLSKEEQPGLLLYVHVILCMYYRLTFNETAYQYHAKQAFEIALPRKWYGPLAEFSYTLTWTEIKEIDFAFYQNIHTISQFVIGNYIKSGFFSTTLPDRKTADPTETKIAIMIANEMSNVQIAEALGLTLYKVKDYVKKIYAHTGVSDRKELKEYVRYHFRF